jgi:nucleoside-diphosphate-sugar epimerase
MPRRALITGATGFVGGHLVEHLAAEGWAIRALVRPTSDTAQLRGLGAELVAGDLSDREAMRGAAGGVEVVFHLAAVTGLRGDRDFDRANVEGTRNLVEAVREADPRPRRLVYLSSYAACGPSGPGRARTLDEPPAPLTAYGRTKLAGEEIVRELEGEGVEVVVLRAPVVYGPGDHALLPYFRLVRLGLAPAPSGGERQLHLIYVGDLARALARAADGRPGTYPVAEPRVHAWDGIVAEMGDVLGRRPLRIPLPPVLVRSVAAVGEAAGSLLGRPVVLNREKAEEMLARSWTCDLSGSEGLLPAEEATPLGEGLSRTAEWYTRQGWL